ncbi:hypothetical protein SDC9_31899 [bioreactor metagenome]|jgi:hypothetical protein|uniref:Cas6b C-terminal domain-containing protein n=1 Tax=bioreactor metagenome TaxID=1076179 RepID=A0A644V3S5_9ZZZZ|nr:CRISPR-associated endonuclease Cas6 [Lentimicrobium sp.]MEA5110263.1 CRISPR-associated endonuclease Cas6 [Lentimicrobium sp.]
MKKIKLLTVTFDTEIRDFEIPAFRGAVVDKVGRDNILFHNHLDDDKLLYKYPLIQYKTINRKPAIQCIDLGVDEIHKFFEKNSWDLIISDRKLEMKILRLDMNQFTMQVWDKLFNYSIRNWIALNKQNYETYLTLDGLAEKVALLEKILTANILAFAKGINWTVDKPIIVKIKTLSETRDVKLKGRTVLGFNVMFASNVFIPKYIGLGKSVSLGFGIVTKPKPEPEQKEGRKAVFNEL